MKEVFQICGISKQGFHQRVLREMAFEDLKQQILMLVKEVRKDHPGMSARVMYDKIQPEGIGRDAFESLVYANGYRVIVSKKYITTTNSSRTKRFDNLLVGKQIDSLNQVWVSDISFYWISDRFYYITIIMDLYSRFIVGFHVSDSLRTVHTSLPALKHALTTRRISQYNDQLIIHSDGGGQYYCIDFIKQTKKAGILNSMGEIVFDNSHAERVIQTIKSQYLKHYNPKNFKELKKQTERAIQMYNFEKPHVSLNKLTPFEFEQVFNDGLVDKCFRMKVFTSISTKNKIYQQKEKRSKKEKVYK
jgi:transposase InsO family protein